MPERKRNAKKSFPRMLVLVTTPRLAEKAMKIYEADGLPLHFRLNATGTASSEMMDILGLAGTEKNILLSVVPRCAADDMMTKLKRMIKIESVNSGIAFTIPINAASTLAIRICESAALSATNDKKGGKRMSESKYTMIAAIVNQGYSDHVMEAARAMGAGGGTVIHSHRISNEAFAGAWGLGMDNDKEIVMIVAENESRAAIMQAIGDACGVKSEAKGVVIALPIENTIGLDD